MPKPTPSKIAAVVLIASLGCSESPYLGGADASSADPGLTFADAARVSPDADAPCPNKGETFCDLDTDGRWTVRTCNSVGEWNRSACAVGDFCVDGGPQGGIGCVGGMGSCEGVAATYARLTGDAATCESPADCARVDGQCGAGLGGCYEAIAAGLPRGVLSALGQRYAQLGCVSVVCDRGRDCESAPAASKPTCVDGTCAL